MGSAEEDLRLDAESKKPAATAERRRGSSGKAYLTRDLTEGSIPKNLWFLAWPQTAEGMLSIVDHLADVAWAGRLGARSIAGLGVAQNYSVLAMTVRMGLDTAMRATVARAIGAKDLRLANHVALQAFTLTVAFSLLMVVVGLALTEPLMRLLGVSDAVIVAGAGYMKAQFLGMGSMAVRMTSAACLQASGDAVTPLKATTVTRLVQLGLSPSLIFGLLFFPEMGLTGAAIASIIAQTLGMTMNLYSLFTGRSRLHLDLRQYRVDFPLLWRLLRLGVPASISSAERTLAQIILIGLVAPFGDYALAAYSLTRRVELIPSFAMMGLGQATGVLVGQNLGAGRPGRARTTVGWAMSMSVVFHILIATLMGIFAERVLSVFSQQPELVGPAVIWLRIQVLGYVFMGAGTIFIQTYNTAGDTVLPMLVTMGTMWLIQQPLAVLLPNLSGLGQFGISWAINISLATRLLIFVPYFFRGAWMRKRVLESGKLATGSA